MGAFIQVSTTLPSEAAANQLAQQLVEQRLAACVQVSGPLTSTYRWQGEIEQGQEWLCTAKTTAEAFARMAKAIAAAHPYEVPEIIATPLAEISDSYAQWLRGQVE